jgi:hypothetical protein
VGSLTSTLCADTARAMHDTRRPCAGDMLLMRERQQTDTCFELMARSTSHADFPVDKEGHSFLRHKGKKKTFVRAYQTNYTRMEAVTIGGVESYRSKGIIGASA